MNKTRDSPAAVAERSRGPGVGERLDCLRDIVNAKAQMVNSFAVLVQPDCDVAVGSARSYELQEHIAGTEVGQNCRWDVDGLGVEHAETKVVREIVKRLLGVPHGYTYVVEPSKHRRDDLRTAVGHDYRTPDDAALEPLGLGGCWVSDRPLRAWLMLGAAWRSRAVYSALGARNISLVGP